LLDLTNVEIQKVADSEQVTTSNQVIWTE